MNEAQLLDLFRNPDFREQAFGLIIDAYQERIYWHLRKMTGSEEDAADLTQDVFIKVWNKLDSFQAKSQLYTWIYRIATNEALAHLRKHKRMQLMELDESVDSRQGQLDTMDAEQIEDRLQAAMATLPERQKQVFVMRYYDELSYQQIAEVLDLSQGALKASFHHAVRKIEDFLKKTLLS